MLPKFPSHPQTCEDNPKLLLLTEECLELGGNEGKEDWEGRKDEWKEKFEGRIASGLGRRKKAKAKAKVRTKRVA
jgi:hypothetical protein